MKTSPYAVMSAFILAGTIALSALATQVTPGTDVSAELKAEKLKNIYRREPRATAIIEKVKTSIDKLKADPTTALQGQKLEQELLRIEMMGSGETEARLKEDMNLLEVASGNWKTPTRDQLTALQERYSKLALDIDDRILVKDFDRLLKKHDRFIRYTALGLWDAEKISAELDKMEEMVASAPDIAFGKLEALKGFQNRRLTAIPKLVYLGTTPHEEMFLSPDRRSLGVIDEGQGGQTTMELADLIVQNPDGTLVDLTTTNNPAYGIPFAPPLNLWMKTRMLENRIPAITLHLASSNSIKQFDQRNPGTAHGTTSFFTTQDVLDGKLDSYLKQAVDSIGKTKQPALIGLFSEFDGELAANSFGADGRTPFYMFDAKIGKLPPELAKEEAAKKAEKGGFAAGKSQPAELSNLYGDPAIPDGPERVRDAWKHIHQLLAGSAPNIGYYSTVDSFHGSKSAFKFPETAAAGTQTWNKLEYYYPGEGVLDWIGIRAVGADPSINPKGPNISDSVSEFFQEVSSSSWHNTPVMLSGLAPSATTSPDAEPAWILTVFKDMIPNLYPNINIVFVDAPEHLTLWSRDAASTFRTNVASNKFYKWPLRFKMLSEQKSSAN